MKDDNFVENIFESKRKDERYEKTRMEQLQEEFRLSDSEVDGLMTFISSSKDETGMLEVLEDMIRCTYLNTRQKVALAHILGIFRTEETMSTKIRSSQDL